MLDCRALEMVPSGSIFYRLRNSPGKYSSRKLPLELTQCNVGLTAGEQGAKTSTVPAARRMSRSEHEQNGRCHRWNGIGPKSAEKPLAGEA